MASSLGSAFSICRLCMRSLLQVPPRASPIRVRSSRRPAVFQPIVPQRGYAAPLTRKSSTAVPHLNSAYTLDEAIAAARVQLINDEGRVEPKPTSLAQLLRSIDRASQHVIQLRGASAAEPNEDGQQLPLVKVVPASELLERLRDKDEKLKASRRTQLSSKIIEVSWQTSEADLEHRCRKLQEFLAEGRKVEVVVQRRRTNRRRAEQPSLERRMEIIERIKSVMGEVPGSTEARSMDVRNPNRQDEVATLFFEGARAARPSAAKAGKETRMTEEDLERKQKAEAKFKRKEEEKAKRVAEEAAERQRKQEEERANRKNWGQRRRPQGQRSGFTRAMY